MGTDAIRNEDQEQEHCQREHAQQNESQCSESTESGTQTKNKLENDYKSRGEDVASSSSSNGRGSRGGYSADCSSSDSSSDSSSNKNGQASVDLRVDNLNLEDKTSRPATDVDDDSAPQKVQDKKHQLKKERKAARQAQRSPVISQEDDRDSITSMNARRVAAQIGELDALLQQSRQMQEAPIMGLGQILPQWNGVRISHPMDPRIDLSTVYRVQGCDAPLPPEIHRAQFTMPGPPPSVDNYLHLMEAVRPFFSTFDAYQIHQPPIQVNQSLQQVGPSNADEPVSSEGFTSFFSTTNSSDSNSAAKGVESSKFSTLHTGSATAPLPPTHVSERDDRVKSLTQPQTGSADLNVDSDSSSMVVLARVKRKHVQQQGNSESSSGDSSSSSDCASGVPPSKDAQAQEGDAVSHGGVEHARAEQEQDSPTSSSSSEEPQHHDARHHPPLQRDGHPGQQPANQGNNGGHGQSRIVSESSAESLQRSSDQFSSSNNANNTSTSGSGSGSAGNSGSGSAGNSGSGSGGDGKGSSTDAAKEDNSAGDQNSNSDENNREKDDKVVDMSVDNTPVNHHHPKHHHNESPHKAQPQESIMDDEVSREIKLMDKKRKRMNMRREYEEQVQQQLGSSDSSGTVEEWAFRPGKPLTLEAALSFTRIARLVVQSAPPFLVVHVNAAYSGLTGIDSHLAIGRPIQLLLSIPEAKTLALLDSAAAVTEAMSTNGAMSSVSGNSSLTNSATGQGARHQEQAETKPAREETQVSGTQNPTENPNLAAAAAAGLARANSRVDEQLDVNVERLVASSGFGQYHIIQVTAKPHHMLGRNVTIVRENPEANFNQYHQRSNTDSNHRDERSRGSSIRSHDAPFHSISCRMGVSPVTSSPNVLIDHGSIVTEQDQGKRRKQHYHHLHPPCPGGSVNSRNGVHRGRQHQPRNHLITHFVIHLEHVVGDGEDEKAEESASSIHDDQKNAPQEDPHPLPHNFEPDGDEVVEDAAESNDPKEPVVVIG